MRIAVYFAPAPGDPWWRFGARWLGRDPACADAGETPPAPPAWPELGWSDAHRRAQAAEPRRYGFHATLVAPFHLADGVSREDASAAARAFAAARAPLRGVPLAVSTEGGFVALRPARAEPRIDALAFDAVRRFDALRAPLTAADRARRAAGLDAHGLALLERWGYARVADRFRFHLTLTGPLDEPALADAARAAARALAHEALASIDVDGIALFVEGDDRAFRLAERHRLDG